MPIILPIELGDVIRVGKFKNKRITVKEIGLDEYSLPTVNGKGIMKIRIEKLMPPKEPKQVKESIGKQPIKFIGFRKNNDGKVIEYIESIVQDLGKEFKGPIIKFGFLNQFTGLRGSKEKGWFRVNKSNIRWEKYGVIWEEGTIQLDIKQDIQENNMNKPNKAKLDRMIREALHSTDTEVKIKQKDKLWWIHQEETDECLNAVGFDSKEAAEHSALTKGYSFPKSEEFNEVESEILTSKIEKTKGVDKVETMKLDKEKEIKLEILRIAKRVIREEISKKKVKLNETDIRDGRFLTLSKIRLITKNKLVKEADVSDNEDLETKAKRYAEIANKMKELEAEMEAMKPEFEQLDQEFRPLLESIGTTKDTFIRAGKLLIKIERAGYEKNSASYKTGFEYLYNKVNGTMKELADEALKMTKTVSYVKSKIAVVQGESVLREENWLGKIKNFFVNGFKKLFGLNKQAKSELDKLEAMI